VRQLAAIAAMLVAGVLPATADASPVRWHQAGASVFGGACAPGEHTGYRGDYLPARWRSFAPLGNGPPLGGQGVGARIRVLNPATHRRLTIRKRDIGLGGRQVAGLRRSIDLYEPVLTRLLGHRSCTWTGTVLWRPL
jgi:hypothetical protein